ncbi:MAG: acetyl-CoA carboxylase carboxyltransferase subunit alpha [Verrucomicrobia bacterium]|nr:acetyl-CoA carboxylase carboxyltransferase subunit alpha [Verrucomicrobiota bacterium]
MATQREVTPLEFERPLRELEKKIEELKGWTREQSVDLRDQIRQLEQKLDEEKQAVYGNLGAWERVLIARHPQRPYFLDFVQMMMTDWIELHGDRLFADDRAMVGGIARLGHHRVMLVATQKGRDTKERTMRNFGMPHPEGYRKALRLMQMAEKFHIPTIAFIDTPGAYPGIGAEERGISQAIAYNLREMMRVRTPMIVIITGEGCSGGAIGIGVGDVVLILQHAYYSVITPEGCAAILWRDAGQMAKAAATMKLASEDLLKQHIVDEILPEPLGGCHYDPEKMAAAIKERLIVHLDRLSIVRPDDLLDRRYQRFREIGVFSEKVIKLKQEEKPTADQLADARDGGVAASSSEA